MMSQQQYHNIMSSLLKQKHALTSLRAKLEERWERECWKCRGFRHWAQHYRKEKKEKGKLVPQNKFEVLASRVMKCGVELRRQKTIESSWVVECFKYGEKEHKCKECPLWKKIEKKGVEKAVHVVKPQKAQPKKLRRVEEKKTVCVAKPWEAQRWWRSKGLITKQRWKQGQRGEISKLLHNCALNK